MIYSKAAFVAFLALADTATVHAVLRGNKTPVDPTEELRTATNKIRALKIGVDDGPKARKQNKADREPPTDNPAGAETTAPTALPTGPPTGLISEMPSMAPVAQPTASPTSQPVAAPSGFDSTIEVICQPDGLTTLTSQERNAKTIICNSAKPSCREAVTAVRESKALQNFFGCAGDLGEGAARKLFDQYASNDVLSGQLSLITATNAILVTERPDAMNAACAAVAAMQSPAVADPCCQGPLGCTSVTGSASNSPPFMTIAITACTGDSACKDMGPNPLILDSSCTGVSSCELMNENEANPSIMGVTFVGEMACTTPQSCEGVGRRSHGDVTIQTGACIGPDACNAAGRRVVQKAPSYRFRSHIDIGPNACVGSNACKDAHSTVNYDTAGKPEGSLTIGAGGCVADGSCEKMGFSDRMRTDIIVPPGGCGSVEGCKGCMTKTECSPDEFYFISDVDGACPKGDSSSGGNPTGDKVEEYCIGKDTLPTDSPTFSPTPFPTPLTPSPTSAPTNSQSQTPSYFPSDAPSRVPSEMPSDIPSSLPSNRPSQVPSERPSDHPSDLPSDEPSQTPSTIPSDLPSDDPSQLPSQVPSAQPSDLPSEVPSAQPSDLPSEEPSDDPSQLPSEMPSDIPSSVPSISPSQVPSEMPSNFPSSLPSSSPSQVPSEVASAQPSDLPSQMPSSSPSQVPSTVPTDTSMPTRAPASLTVGCLETPGDDTTTFNEVTGDVLCDGATGTCATFVAAVDALGDKGKMIKSIFGCSHEGTPNVVTQQVAQKRFDTMKNDASMTQLLVDVVATMKLYTGIGDAVDSACGSSCCTGFNPCATSYSVQVMTVTDNSCHGEESCSSVQPGTIILGSSCTADYACQKYGWFTSLEQNAEAGYRVIGPNACTDRSACTDLGRNLFGNVRVGEGACTGGEGACKDAGGKSNQGTTTAPVVTNVFIGKNACVGINACTDAHAVDLIDSKTGGSLVIEEGACAAASSCNQVGFGTAAVNDIIVRTGTCSAAASDCDSCAQGALCTSTTETYIIDNADKDCPGPDQSACEVV